MLWPNGSTTRPHISSPFGPRSGGAFSVHYGADLTGYETVRAAGAGLVTFAGWMNDSAGNTVVIDLGGGVSELHMHLATITVSRGTRVGVGHPLGRMGMTGNATGECDHFEIRIHGVSVDPIPYVTARLTITDKSEEDDMKLLFVTDSVDGNNVPGWVLLNTRTGKLLTLRLDAKNAQANADSWARVWGNARHVTRQDMLNGVAAVEGTL